MMAEQDRNMSLN